MDAMRSKPSQEQSEQDLIITRIFDAPREQVWRVWTEPELVKRWWGPIGFTSPSSEIDLRVGGRYLFDMRSPEGQDFYSTGVYREIVPLERIVATDSFADEKGNVVPASTYGMSGDWPSELLLTVTFEDHEGKTRLTLRHHGFPSANDRELAREGWQTSLDKLAEALKELERMPA